MSEPRSIGEQIGEWLSDCEDQELLATYNAKALEIAVHGLHQFVGEKQVELESKRGRYVNIGANEVIIETQPGKLIRAFSNYFEKAVLVEGIFTGLTMLDDREVEFSSQSPLQRGNVYTGVA
jgi:hypothetical protein